MAQVENMLKGLPEWGSVVQCKQHAGGGTRASPRFADGQLCDVEQVAAPLWTSVSLAINSRQHHINGTFLLLCIHELLKVPKLVHAGIS